MHIWSALAILREILIVDLEQIHLSLTYQLLNKRCKGVRTPLKNVICNWKRKGWIEKLATGNLRKKDSRAISSSKKKK